MSDAAEEVVNGIIQLISVMAEPTSPLDLRMHHHEWVSRALDNLVADRESKSNPPAGGEGKPEPVAWLHELKEPDKAWTYGLSKEAEHPWSHWIASHKARCEFRSTPLYAAPLSRSGDSALVEAVGLLEEVGLGFGSHGHRLLAKGDDQDWIARRDKFIQQHGERK